MDQELLLIAEEQSYQRIKHSFKTYSQHSLAKIDQKYLYFQSLSHRHQALLNPTYLKQLEYTRASIHQNQLFIDALLSNQPSTIYYHSTLPHSTPTPTTLSTATSATSTTTTPTTTPTTTLSTQSTPSNSFAESGDATMNLLSKVNTTLKQVVRDWSSSGALERSLTYDPILMLIEGHERVLVPGSGLSRLAYELSRKGCTVEGCEISFHMLIASHYILNQ